MHAHLHNFAHVLKHTCTRRRAPPSACSPGASEAQLDRAEQALQGGLRLPPALRVLYRVHDGQQLEFDRQVDTQHITAMHPSIFHGLFGGYSFYNHAVSCRMLPLRRLVEWTLRADQQPGFDGASRHVLFAASQG